MVIANSDSNTTLVSLNNDGGNDKNLVIDQKIVAVGESGLLRYVEPSSSATSQFSSENNTTCDSDGGVQTELLISIPDTTSSSSSSVEDHVPLYLPLREHQQPLSRENHFELDADEYIARNYYSIDNNETNNCHPYSQPQALPSNNVLPGAEILKDSRERLLASKRRRSCSSGEEDRSLYVAQGERANATSEQYDVLMSDKATTCHILAFRSRTISDQEEDHLPLASLTHLDGPQYEECVRDMIREHIDYHYRDNNSRRKRTKFAEEEKKSEECREPNNDGNNNSNGNGKITIDIHVMGGFNDIDSSSSNITDWLMRLLARMAQEFKDQRVGVKLVVKTLVVSSSNNEVDNCNNDSPIGRGFGIDLRTGNVFLTEHETETTTTTTTGTSFNSSGPVPVLRSVRLWSRCCSTQSHRLSVVHTVKDVHDLWASFGIEKDDAIRKEYALFWVQPFRFRSIPDADLLLGLPDELLLQYTSTSPDVEEAGFCDELRASVKFLKHQCVAKKEDGRSYFGKSYDRPMVFSMRHDDDRKQADVQQQRSEWKKLAL